MLLSESCLPIVSFYLRLINLSAWFACTYLRIQHGWPRWFVLLSESCLPMVSFETFYKDLHEIRHSTFDMKDHTRNPETLNSSSLLLSFYKDLHEIRHSTFDMKDHTRNP